ncbi:MAG: hypothetical protein CMH78_03440 [Nitrospinae bacterium]|nr:hypothetical protein [Nitrospinota bacterium]|tara:strand:+ start:278 stop:676 length:399 start_codon:yes stop_codon:yes gene_type:complete
MMAVILKNKRTCIFLISGVILLSGLMIMGYLILTNHKSQAFKVPATYLKPDFEGIENPYKDKYVIFFNFDLKRDAQKQILMDFPKVEYIRNGNFPQVVLIRIEKGASVVVERLLEHQGINGVTPEEPGMICH